MGANEKHDATYHGREYTPSGIERRIKSEVSHVVANVSNWPDQIASQMLGRDLAEPIDKIVEALLPLFQEAKAEAYKDAERILHEEARWQLDLHQRHKEYRFKHCSERMTEMENCMTIRANQYKEQS